jgi:hypothetical protein
MTLLQIFSAQTHGLHLIENVEDFTNSNKFKMEVEIPPKEIISKVFKVDLKKKILKGDCKFNK